MQSFKLSVQTFLRSFNRLVFISLALLGLSVSSVNASTIIGGDLLDQAGANQLESWLGVGSQTFTNIFDGTADATSTSWHTAVDGIGDTISIYEITYSGTDYLIGGYRHVSNTSTPGYTSDSAAFIFNLSDTTPFMQDQTPTYYSGLPSHYDESSYFATFGGGHDLYGGNQTLRSGGYVNGGLSYGANGMLDPGPVDILGLQSNTNRVFSVKGLETYTYAPSAVPVPAAVWLFGTALIGLIGFGKRRKAA